MAMIMIMSFVIMFVVVVIMIVVVMIMPVMVMSFMVFVIMISVIMSMSFMVFSMIMSFVIFVWSWTKNFLLSTKYRAEMIFMNAKIWFSTIAMIMKISIVFMSFMMVMSSLSKTELFIFRTFNNTMIVTSMFIMCWHTRSITAQKFSFSTCPSTINFRFKSGNNMFHSHLGIFRHGRFHPTVSFKSSSVQITPRKSNTIWFFGTFNTTIIS